LTNLTPREKITAICGGDCGLNMPPFTITSQVQKGQLLYIELMAAIQIGLSNPNFGLPLDHSSQEKVKVVESYLKKELIVETIETPPEKPHKARTRTFSVNMQDDVEVIGTSYEQCVVFYKRMSGRTDSLGYAGNIKPEGFEPRIGAGALWRGIGHIGFVTQIDGDMITVEDSNWIRGKVTRHTLPSSSFRGYIY